MGNCLPSDGKQAENQKSPVLWQDLHDQIQSLSVHLGFLSLHGELFILPLIHSTEIRNRIPRAVESAGPSEDLRKLRRD